ncbi:MAG: MBL fold metallo-hydrolase [Phycisphaerae bacterium]
MSISVLTDFPTGGVADTLGSMITVGRFKLFSVINGWLRLDGGAMFGVVPRVVWSRKAKPDEQHRVKLAMRSLLAVDNESERVILVDTGAGSKWPDDEAARFGIENVPDAIPSALEPFGLSEAAVTDVVVTHLHFDHNGGLTEWTHRPGGPTRLRFPQARHWIHRRHWDHAIRPTERDQASFLDRDLAALAGSEAVHFLEGDDPACPLEGVRWELSHGHTPYQLLPRFEGDQADVLWVGDMVPTSQHLPLPWIMAYDLEPLVTLEEKRALHRRCERDGLQVAFPHDPDIGGVAVDLVGPKPIISRVLDL